MQSAAALHKESEEAMRGAQRLQSELVGQAEALKRESEHLQQRESQLASVSKYISIYTVMVYMYAWLIHSPCIVYSCSA